MTVIVIVTDCAAEYAAWTVAGLCSVVLCRCVVFFCVVLVTLLCSGFIYKYIILLM